MKTPLADGTARASLTMERAKDVCKGDFGNRETAGWLQTRLRGRRGAAALPSGREHRPGSAGPQGAKPGPGHTRTHAHTCVGLRPGQLR